jgi:hypothetical protein
MSEQTKLKEFVEKNQFKGETKSGADFVDFAKEHWQTHRRKFQPMGVLEISNVAVEKTVHSSRLFSSADCLVDELYRCDPDLELEEVCDGTDVE